MSGVGCLRTTATARRNARQHYVKSKRKFDRISTVINSDNRCSSGAPIVALDG